jgi:hypothetical protein
MYHIARFGSPCSLNDDTSLSEIPRKIQPKLPTRFLLTYAIGDSRTSCTRRLQVAASRLNLAKGNHLGTHLTVDG